MCIPGFTNSHSVTSHAVRGYESAGEVHWRGCYSEGTAGAEAGSEDNTGGGGGSEREMEKKREIR